MVDLVSRGRVELFISTSGLVLAVRRDAEGRLAFERVDRLDIDFETYQMGEANVPADILWSFRRRHANLETSDWEFYVKLSDTIRSNLLRFMSDNSPGVVAIGADEKVRYE
jgi:hypothetical protein